MRLLSILESNRNIISVSDARLEYLDNVQEEARKNRENAFEKELKKLVAEKWAILLNGILYYRYHPEAKEHFCRCPKCGNYYIVIEHWSDKGCAVWKYKIDVYSGIIDERENEKYELDCPYCYPD